MKRINVTLLTLLAVILGMTSCSDSNNDVPEVKESNLIVKLNLQENVNGQKIYDALLEGVEVNTKRYIKQNISIEDNHSFKTYLKPGLYNLSISGKINVNNEEKRIKGYLKNLEIDGSPLVNQESKISIQNNSSDDFVIEELFYTGNRHPSTNKVYIGDQYFKITNNSDVVKYADGLAIAETEFMTSNKYDYTPDRMNEMVAIDALYVVPGDGKTYPVQPGESIIICDKATNHTIEVPNSFDLSKANFEWYDESSVPGMQDTDNPDVPNLDKIYSYTRTIWILTQQGNKAYCLLRLQEDAETFLQTRYLDYSFVHPATNKKMDKKSYFIPNSWFLDVVTLASNDKYEWQVTDLSLDAGYTTCGIDSKDTNRNGKSVRRKIAYTTAEGRKVLQKTNNSTDDFERDAIPSLLNK